MSLKMLRLITVLLTTLSLCSASYALGNHPDSTVCSAKNPYQAICTHSLHNLEGWYGRCYPTRDAAQQDADQHAEHQHLGNSRWTGVKMSTFN